LAASSRAGDRGIGVPSRLALFASGPVGFQVARGMTERGVFPQLLVTDQSFRELQGQTAERVFDEQSTTCRQFEDETAESVARSLKTANIDIGILAWWPTILREPVLSAPTRGFLNFHPSLLPFNRGRHTTFWNLIENVPFGVTIHWVDDKIDNGPIAFQRPIAKSWEDNSERLYRRAQAEIVSLFFEHLDDIVIGKIPARQSEAAPSSRLHYASEIDAASQIALDRNYSGRELLNIIRGKQFAPYAPAHFIDSGVRYDVRISITRSDESRS
jgi:methionyl-tRNA formyltransferase